MMFHIAANVIEFHSDGTSLLGGAASAVVTFAVAELLLHRISRRRPV